MNLLLILAALVSLLPQITPVAFNLTSLLQSMGLKPILAFIVDRDWSRLISLSLVMAIYLSNKVPVPPFIELIVLSILILPSHISGLRIVRRNSEKMAHELVDHACATLLSYYSVLVVPCLMITLLNPSPENIAGLTQLPTHLVSLFPSLATWAFTTAIISPMLWETNRSNLYEMLIQKSYQARLQRLMK